MGILPDYALWDARTPVPPVEELARPRGATDVMVHQADPAFGFLHDNAVAWHGDTLFAAWYNCPAWEMAESSCIRGRRSRDGGRSWSDIEIVAADEGGRGVLYVPVVFLSHEGTLFAFVSNMEGADRVTRCEAFALGRVSGRWVSRGFIAGPFLPNCAPLRMGNGNYIMAGRMARVPGAKPEMPAVAVSRGDAVTAPWTTIALADGESALPHEPFPESTLWVNGPDITAVVRGGFVFSSPDYGRTWKGPFRHNLPAEASKLYAGTLSTGQRYLVWNRPDPGGAGRNLLTLAVGRPGGRELAAMWKLRQGYDQALQAGPQWSYPCAIEHAGNLYVIYTSEKKHSVLSIIPLDALAEKAPPDREQIKIQHHASTRA
jgi:hypothetical protein